IPESLIEQSTIGDSRYIIPVGVHPGNAVFFNRELLPEHDVEVDDDIGMDECFEIAGWLQEAGIPALPRGSNDALGAPHLFENALAGRRGAEAYNGVWDGTTDWGGDEVAAACEDMVRFLGYVNDDHPALAWDGAMTMVIEGAA